MTCRRIFLSGPPGCGKTTAVRKVADILGGAARGFYTLEVRDANRRRIGFRVVPLDGDSGELAAKGAGPGPRVGSYRVNVESFERVALPSLEVAEDRIVIIDEIGKMECFSEKFVRRVREIFQADSGVLATVPSRGGGELLEEIRRMSDAETYTLTPENRDVLPAQIAAILTATAQGRND